MGRKKYFCDFCNRHFNDDKNTRTKHLNSVGHLNLKKEHYNMFRGWHEVKFHDPEVLLREESAKKPCRLFHSEGYCSFGGSCTFSHYSREALDAIQLELSLKKKKQNRERNLNSWLQRYYQSIELKKIESRKLEWSCELPPNLVISSGLLPPSMLPFSVIEFINTEMNSWG